MLSLAEFQIKRTRLTAVFNLGTSVTNFSLFKPQILSRLPSIVGEGPFAYFAAFSMRTLGHAYIGIITQTGRAKDGKFLR